MKLLLSSDWHIRTDNPICRVDDFQKVQLETLKQISKIALENKATIIVAGDLLQRSKEENMQSLLNRIHDVFKNNEVYFIPGQHDLLNHSMDNFDNGNIGIINRWENWFCEQVSNCNLFCWGEEINNSENTDVNIVVFHKFVSDQKLPPWMKDKGIEAKDLCEKYDYDVFVCGDNHDGFIYEHPKTKQLVFNCGCITRQSLDKKNYRPRVYLFDTETRKYEIIYLLDNDPKVITNVTNNKQQLERASRIDSFIELAESKEGLTFNFEDDLKLYCKKNKVKSEVEKEIENILEECAYDRR
jgi:predicted MPP superfamily phosphohydrolase